ncbi:Cytochrome c family protein [Xanthomonas hortorum pv. vitians]|nr:Cytochrome c family protein [Xanthomonas hortorum pv. vitians]
MRNLAEIRVHGRRWRLDTTRIAGERDSFKTATVINVS